MAAPKWTDSAKEYGTDWTYWGGDKVGHDAGWYSLGDVQKWTPQDQWDPSKYQTYSGWKYDTGSGSQGILDANTGTFNYYGPNFVDPLTGKTSGSPFDARTGYYSTTWTPEMEQSYKDWYGTGGAGSTVNAGAPGTTLPNPDEYYAGQARFGALTPEQQYTAGMRAANEAANRAANRASDATLKWGNTKEGALTQPGDAEDWYASHKGDLDRDSNAEDLYKQGTRGLDEWYSHSADETSRNLNNQFRLRGLYNSGANDVAQTHALTELWGSQAKEMGSRALSADQQRLARMALGASAAKESQTQRTNRLLGGAGLLYQGGTSAAGYTGHALDGLNEEDRALIEEMIQGGILTPAQIDAVANQGAFNNAVDVFKALYSKGK